VDFCLDHSIKVLNVPPIDTWINGQFSARQLQYIKIENLLEREPIKINNEEIGARSAISVSLLQVRPVQSAARS
jgi:FlaA1/EpsC-like NDP-sugar epimerase